MIHINSLQSYIFEHLLDLKNMESRLIIRNFGPIKDVDLALKNVNVFIGPQASGKSTIAKIFTIFKSPRKFIKEIPGIGIEDNHKYPKETILEILKLFNIDTFLQDSTEICFESQVHKISLISGEIIYESKLLNKIKIIRDLLEDFENNKQKIADNLILIFKNFILFHIRVSHFINTKESGENKSTKFADLSDLLRQNKETVSSIIEILRNLEISLSTNAAVYIPAERIIANIIAESIHNLLINEVPIPKHILSFSAELEKLSTTSIDLGFIKSDLRYIKENGKHRIYMDDINSIALGAAASGIQSVIPILMFSDKMRSIDHKSFVIEEAELNLFPTAQYRLIELIESFRNDPSVYGWEDIGIIHTYTTHSPYILSALNNFLYAHKVLNNLKGQIPTDQNKNKLEEDVANRVKSVVKAVINPKSFTAYQIKDGSASSIFDESIGLISDNYIDESTDEINDDFDKLMELLDNGINK